jgi:integrase
MSPEVRSFCTLLAYSGARLSEVLALPASRVDLSAGLVIFESLKKRRSGMFRAVPVPGDLLAELDEIHGISGNPNTVDLRRLWPWSRTTAWSRVKETMAMAPVIGPQATPKGLRHGFAVAALQAGIPINLVRRWLGHARLSTTEIYAEAMGDEERAIAERLWKTF